MNFLVDAHLPRRMTIWFAAAGCNAIHTSELPDANRTTDEQINDLADREQRVVITKDADFVDSHLLQGRPPKLLLISTGTAFAKNTDDVCRFRFLIAASLIASANSARLRSSALPMRSGWRVPTEELPPSISGDTRLR